MAEALKIWPEKPKPEKPAEKPKHRYEWAIGFCPECGDIVTRPESDPGVALRNLAKVREFYVKHFADSPFECRTCHAPLPLPPDSTKEDLEKIEGCPFCGSTEARVREKKKA
jgi:hypothetical protein